MYCQGRAAFDERYSECGCAVTHPPHFVSSIPHGHGSRWDAACRRDRPMSPFVRRALARELPAKEIAR